MARNIKQSRQGLSTTAISLYSFRGETDLEIALANLGLPTLLHVLDLAVECASQGNVHRSDLLNNARTNPHQFTEACFPLDMEPVYFSYEAEYVYCLEEPDEHSKCTLTLGGYIASLVLSKLWRLCDFMLDCEIPVFDREAVLEITNICLLAEQGLRIRNSEFRSDMVGSSFTLMNAIKRVLH